MIEVGLVAAMLAGLLAVPALMTLLSWELLFGGGVALVGLGMLIGVPAGALYHVQLYRALAPAKLLSARWWLHPTDLHGSLPSAARPSVMRWFYLGALGFVLSIAGCLFVAVGALRSR